MSDFAFVVPGKPCPQNAAYRRQGGKGRRLYMADEAKGYKLAIALVAASAAPTGWDKTALVRVKIRFVFDSERPDLDGPLKLALDALQGVRAGARTRGGCLVNDRQVRVLTLERGMDRVRPRTEIEVETLP